MNLWLLENNISKNDLINSCTHWKDSHVTVNTPSTCVVWSFNTTVSKRNQRFPEKQVTPDLEEFHESKKSFPTKRKHKWELRSLRIFWRVLDVNFNNRIIWPSRRTRTLKGLSILNMLKLLCEHSCVHNDTERKK